MTRSQDMTASTNVVLCRSISLSKRFLLWIMHTSLIVSVVLDLSYTYPKQQR